MPELKLLEFLILQVTTMAKLKDDMERIHEKTDFKIDFAGITQLNEFQYTHGGSVQPGLEYHIHYTDDKKEVFMTGGSHNSSSKIIQKVKGDKSLFSKYTSLKSSRKTKYPDKFSPNPTEGDYRIGVIYRYFARKANNLNGELFEVSEEDFKNRNNLFSYFQIKWRISGKKLDVIQQNKRITLVASAKRGNEQLRKIVFPLQLWNPPKGSPDDIQSKLDRRKII